MCRSKYYKSKEGCPISTQCPEVRVYFITNQNELNKSPWLYNEAEINAMLKSSTVQVRDTVYCIDHTLFDASTRALVVYLEKAE
ncbi:hypothetical protein Desor_5181 [Desulfosporosinus orientis DSM 765]|uniref:Uncharacterized protein n=1 Tax=Desulfosporosinus orientis (strain ATCC 19365 / DSM 765 / NCIMB 8382 / VKM B-1628 / Singapore I) TaxID=768706 RepID=G7W760_DESOD|nr:hypothetical protein Desor_5181 [Desulfosporosinus orientis DSM 765]